MAFVKILVHAVWATKKREHFLTPAIKPVIIGHIIQNAKSKDIYIDRINGSTDHLHALIGLNADLSISKTMQLIKGESAFWINKQKLTVTKFEWADEYYAASVSPSLIDRVRDYIDKQEVHHASKTFQEEYHEYMQLLGFNFHG